MEDAHVEHLFTCLMKLFDGALFKSKDKTCMPTWTRRPFDDERFDNSISKARACKKPRSPPRAFQQSRQFCPDENHVQLVLAQLVIEPVECMSRVLEPPLATYDLINEY